jgi:hypothetical protein
MSQATAPKSRYSDVEIAAYMASEEGQVAKWLSFEDDYHQTTADIAAEA